MTTAPTDADATTGHTYTTPTLATLPQTPQRARGQSVWTQLSEGFHHLSRTPAARQEYRQWRHRHDWRAEEPAELAIELRDAPHALGVIVAYHQSGSSLAAAILVEAFRPALITFTRYARLDDCEQADRAHLRAQVVLATFYEVASTTNPHSESIAGRLYGETLKRVTRARPQIPQHPASDLFGHDHLGLLTQSTRHGHTTSRHEGSRGGRRVPVADTDVAPIALRSGTDWDAIERKGLVRDLLTTARDRGVINHREYDLVSARYLTDNLVPIPTLARQFGESVSYCETKIRRALAKLRTQYSRETSPLAGAVA